MSMSLYWHDSECQYCDIQLPKAVKTWTCIDLDFQTTIWKSARESAHVVNFRQCNEIDITNLALKPSILATSRKELQKAHLGICSNLNVL